MIIFTFFKLRNFGTEKNCPIYFIGIGADIHNLGLSDLKSSTVFHYKYMISY